MQINECASELNCLLFVWQKKSPATPAAEYKKTDEAQPDVKEEEEEEEEKAEEKSSPG